MKAVLQSINFWTNVRHLCNVQTWWKIKHSVAYSFSVFHCWVSALFIRAAIFEIQLSGSEESDFLSFKFYFRMKRPTWNFRLQSTN